MRFRPSRPFALLLLGGLAAAGAAPRTLAQTVAQSIAQSVAQTLEITPAPAARVPGTLPDRGQSMAAVEARFGAPAARSSAVGQPPITRWSYPNFTVYFEYDHVVHAVAVSATRTSSATL
jgi:hypothetical protein